MNPTYAAFWRSLSPEHQEVIRRMDEHENLGHGEAVPLTEEMLSLLAKLWPNINELAERLGEGDEAEIARHAETLMLILSFSPNGGSYWFITELIRQQPEVYDEIFRRVFTQKPLEMYGKLLWERLSFHITRKQAMTLIYSPENRLAVRTALEAMVREK